MDRIYSPIPINSALYWREKLIHFSKYLYRQHGRHISIKMRLDGLQRCSGRYEEYKISCPYRQSNHDSSDLHLIYLIILLTHLSCSEIDRMLMSLRKADLVSEVGIATGYGLNGQVIEFAPDQTVPFEHRV